MLPDREFRLFNDRFFIARIFGVFELNLNKILEKILWKFTIFGISPVFFFLQIVYWQPSQNVSNITNFNANNISINLIHTRYEIDTFNTLLLIRPLDIESQWTCLFQMMSKCGLITGGRMISNKNYYYRVI
jgi:hypothetical protein